MRKDVDFCLKKFQVKVFGNEKLIGWLSEQIPNDEIIRYITPTNITHSTSSATNNMSGAVAFTDKAFYVVDARMNASAINNFVTVPLSDIKEVAHRANGLTGAKFTIQLVNGTGYKFLAGYKKSLAEDLQITLEKIVKGEKTNGPEDDKLKGTVNFRRIGIHLFIDDENRMWRYYPDVSLTGDAKGTPVEYSFENVISCEIVENGSTQTTVKKKGIGRAVVGGALFGAIGAIVGATTGSSKVTEKPTVNSLWLTVGLTGAEETQLTIPLIKAATPTNSIIYKTLRKNAEDMMIEFQKMIGELELITDKDNSSKPAFSEADELRKYKGLLDDGIISQDEFEAKKKQLLGL